MLCNLADQQQQALQMQQQQQQQQQALQMQQQQQALSQLPQPAAVPTKRQEPTQQPQQQPQTRPQQPPQQQQRRPSSGPAGAAATAARAFQCTSGAVVGPAGGRLAFNKALTALNLNVLVRTGRKQLSVVTSEQQLFA
jgi:outer membrane biosynthesis protein TonB